jgi:hypothetical protein
MLYAARWPWRWACWAVIGVSSPGRVRSGTAAASPTAYTSGYPGTVRYSSTTSRPRSVLRPLLVAATAGGPGGGEVLGMLALAGHAHVRVRHPRSMILADPTSHRSVQDALAAFDHRAG